MIKLRGFIPKNLPPDPPPIVVIPKPKPSPALSQAKALAVVPPKTLALRESWVEVDPPKNLVQLINEGRENGYTGAIMDFLRKLDEDFKDIVKEYYRVQKLWEARFSPITRLPERRREPEYFTNQNYQYEPPPTDYKATWEDYHAWQEFHNPKPKQQQQSYQHHTSPPKAKVEEVKFFKEHVDPKIVHKVRTLLRMTESAHKGEADLAMKKAKELSAKYGIIFETVSKW